jgi:hypothetical protein
MSVDEDLDFGLDLHAAEEQKFYESDFVKTSETTKPLWLI